MATVMSEVTCGETLDVRMRNVKIIAFLSCRSFQENLPLIVLFYLCSEKSYRNIQISLLRTVLHDGQFDSYDPC